MLTLKSKCFNVLTLKPKCQLQRQYIHYVNFENKDICELYSQINVNFKVNIFQH